MSIMTYKANFCQRMKSRYDPMRHIINLTAQAYSLYLSAVHYDYSESCRYSEQRAGLALWIHTSPSSGGKKDWQKVRGRPKNAVSVCCMLCLNPW